MPNLKEHAEKYKKNKEFIKIDNLSGDYSDWYITGLFYTTVHLIEGYLSEYGAYHSSNHLERKKQILGNSVLKDIFSKYNTIYTQSIRARYLNYTFTETEINTLSTYCNEIQSYIEPRLKSHLDRINVQ